MPKCLASLSCFNRPQPLAFPRYPWYTVYAGTIAELEQPHPPRDRGPANVHRTRN